MSSEDTFIATGIERPYSPDKDEDVYHTLDPGSIFRQHLQEQIGGLIEREFEHDGKKEFYPDIKYNKDSIRLLEGVSLLFKKARTLFDEYWRTDISKLGNQFHSSDSFVDLTDFIDQLSSLDENETYGATNDCIYENRLDHSLFEVFSLYVCIKHLNPDRVVVLVNGASRLGALCGAMGFDVSNLSIHRDAGQDHRKDISTDIVYDGDAIESDSRVLLLEDTSGLGPERTYREARGWLKSKFGVSDAPVFMARIVGLVLDDLDDMHQDVDRAIGIQNELDAENCFVSMSIFSPVGKEYQQEFYSRSHGMLTEVMKNNPGLHEEFFDFIKGMRE
jgi:hypothetical protein